MAGYDTQKKMSNNAVRDMEERGLVPITDLPIPFDMLKHFMQPTEWHHIGQQFNWIPFVSREKAMALFGLEQSNVYPTNNWAARAYREHQGLPTHLIPCANPCGPLPECYPYAYKGQWRMSESDRERLALPATDDIIAKFSVKGLMFGYMKRPDSESKTFTCPSTTIKVKQSGYWLFETFVRHPDHLEDLNPLIVRTIKSQLPRPVLSIGL